MAKEVVVQTKVKKTEVEFLVDKLGEALEKKMEAENEIKRSGKQIIVPEFMDLGDAAEAITSYAKQMEDDAQQVLEWTGHEDELLLAISNGMRSCFGQFFGTSGEVMTFFGAMKVAGQNRAIATGAKTSQTVPVGTVSVPGLPIKMQVKVARNEKDKMASKAALVLSYKKKYEPLVAMMKDAVDKELRENPLFKTKAIDSQFRFIDLDAFPIDKVVYSRESQRQLDTHVFGPIRNSKALEARGLTLRRSVLLHGPFGTGKTLTALMAARSCMENGWTFMNVIPGDSIEAALTFAKKYQPCVVFFEDIDQATPQGRTPEVNTILNVVDGFLSKSAKVMTILTTNHADKIEQAMLRPGRIDAVVKLGDIDEEVIQKMVKVYCPEMTNGLDLPKLLKAADNYTPSFVSEACHRAVLYGLDRANGNGGIVKLSSEDIEDSLKGLRAQFELMTRDLGKQTPKVEAAFADLIDTRLKGFSTAFEERLANGVKEKLNLKDCAIN